MKIKKSNFLSFKLILNLILLINNQIKKKNGNTNFQYPTFPPDKNGSPVALQAKLPVKKASHIDPLILKLSLKVEFIIYNFHQLFSCLVKPYFMFCPI